MPSRSTGLAARLKRYGWPRWIASTLSRKAKESSVNSAHPVPCRSRCLPPPSQASRNNPMVLPGRAALLAIGWFCGVLGNAQQPPVNVATPVSTADASCGACHAQILHSYLATPMANASGLAAERQKTGVFDHKASGMRYALSVDGPKLMLTYRDANDPWI